LVMMLSLIWLGLYPQPVLNSSRQAISNLRMSASAGTKAEGARVGQEEDKRLNADVSQRTGGPAEKSHKSGGV
jgi:hypothetical protein